MNVIIETKELGWTTCTCSSPCHTLIAHVQCEPSINLSSGKIYIWFAVEWNQIFNIQATIHPFQPWSNKTGYCRINMSCNWRLPSSVKSGPNLMPNITAVYIKDKDNRISCINDLILSASKRRLPQLLCCTVCYGLLPRQFSPTRACCLVPSCGPYPPK